MQRVTSGDREGIATNSQAQQYIISVGIRIMQVKHKHEAADRIGYTGT